MFLEKNHREFHIAESVILSQVCMISYCRVHVKAIKVLCSLNRLSVRLGYLEINVELYV